VFYAKNVTFRAKKKAEFDRNLNLFGRELLVLDVKGEKGEKIKLSLK
jgi:hypothetical protein